MKMFETREELLYLIESKRIEMILEATKTGLLSYETIKRSKELDELLNLHEKLIAVSI
ncbi:aspartyl-phosphate phosphatase Spo0E family protein [Bacillus sp. T3]|uniref:aspartyl-phosphate phosphatase Spo0E family protein n=1 Tax=Bacillus sp. T3 TaxID=467262 RepID=UPI002980BFC2|nr:aspartyl-phosphate phosphatase Spo0E family protein [Bacillus sp. T3]